MTDDFIRRIDAMQACQVGPSDEWSKSTRDGYNQAATDCAMNMLRVPAVTVQAQIDAAVAAERERCAKVADAQEALATAREEKTDDEDDWDNDWEAGVVFGTKIGARMIAAAIRKGDQP
jgi:hypothetical protein